MDWRRTGGGSLKVLEFIEDHPAELAYDLRSRFQLSIEDIGGSLSFREAILLLSILLKSPDSWLYAAEKGWDYPVSKEWIVQKHTFDLLAAANSKKPPKPYPAPWREEGSGRIGKTVQPVSDVLKRLESMNPKDSNGN